MSKRPTIWRSPTMRARIANQRRQRDANALRKLAEAYDARQSQTQKDNDEPLANP